MDDQGRAKVATILYRMFEMRFSREWDDLPEEVRMDYLDNADELAIELRDVGLVIKKMGT